MSRLLLVFLLLPLAPARGDDLTSLNHPLLKEPAYKTKPQYALLVFGPQARTRIWIVRDGDRLFVDRNGNGDLTEPGDMVTYKNEEGWSDPKEDQYTFIIDELRDGPLVHKHISIAICKIDHMADQDDAIKKLLAKEPNFRAVRINAEIETPGRRGSGVGGRLQYMGWHKDHRGFLRLSDSPQNAPVLHFGGRWVITQFDANPLRPGRGTDFVLGVGTIGRGPGTTVYVSYENLIPSNMFPKLAVTYPAKNGDPPITEHYELKERC